MRKFDNNTEISERIFSKRELERAIRNFRDNGYTVEKRGTRYEVLNRGRLVFSAIKSAIAYRVRLDKEILI